MKNIFALLLFFSGALAASPVSPLPDKCRTSKTLNSDIDMFASLVNHKIRVHIGAALLSRFSVDPLPPFTCKGRLKRALLVALAGATTYGTASLYQQQIAIETYLLRKYGEDSIFSFFSDFTGKTAAKAIVDDRESAAMGLEAYLMNRGAEAANADAVVRTLIARLVAERIGGRDILDSIETACDRGFRLKVQRGNEEVVFAPEDCVAMSCQLFTSQE